MQSVYKYFKINKINTFPYSPQTDGLVERFNRTLSTMLAAYSNSAQSDWDVHLPLVLFAYRTCKQSTTGKTPFGALYGKEARLGDLDNYNLGYEANDFIKNLRMQWQEAKINIEKQAGVSKKNYDSKYDSKPFEYKEGEYVRLKIHPTKIGLKKKLRNDNYGDPVKINQVLSEQNIEVLIKDKPKIINVRNCKPKEPDRIVTEIIRSEPTRTHSGRISNTRYIEH
jgi:hypothetical protein